MRKKISKLRWNFFSILIIILLGESLYHFYIVPKAKEFSTIYKTEFRIICKINNSVSYYHKDFCSDYQHSLKDLINIHLTEVYNLSGKFHVKFNGNYSYYTIETSNVEQETKLINSLNKIIPYQSEIFKKQINSLFLDHFLNYLVNVISNVEKLSEVANNKLFKIKYEDIIKLKKEAHHNLEQFQKFKKSYKDLKPEQMYSLKIKKIQTKVPLYPKFGRLNYINIFLSSFIFGIFINILFVLIIEIKKLYKW